MAERTDARMAAIEARIMGWEMTDELDEVFDAYFDGQQKRRAVQLVTLRLPAAWYHVLLCELAFCMNAHGAWGEHHSDNAYKLYEMIVKQGGVEGVD